MEEEKTLEQKVEELVSLNEQLAKDNEELKKSNEDLQRKIAGLRIDGITKKVTPSEPKVEEEITLDFDF